MDVVVADVTAAGKETARAVLKGVSSTITLGRGDPVAGARRGRQT